MNSKPKLLFYFCGRPVYEGSELDQQLKRNANKSYNQVINDTKKSAVELEKQLNRFFNGNK